MGCVGLVLGSRHLTDVNMGVGKVFLSGELGNSLPFCTASAASSANDFDLSLFEPTISLSLIELFEFTDPYQQGGDFRLVAPRHLTVEPPLPSSRFFLDDFVRIPCSGGAITNAVRGGPRIPHS